MLQRKLAVAFSLYVLLIPMFAFAKDTPLKVYQAPPEVIEKIKAEGMGDNSKVMETLSYLTNVIGGRLTNSPNMKRANEWTRDTMAKWGMQNAHLEAWGPFGRGWSLEEFSAQVVEPQTLPLIAFPKGLVTFDKRNCYRRSYSFKHQIGCGFCKISRKVKRCDCFDRRHSPIKT
jgi:hypothetical protein